MKTFFMKLIVLLIERVTSPQFVKRVKELVMYYAQEQIGGDEKRKKVIQYIEYEGWKFAGSIVNLTIEAVLNYLKLRQPKLFEK
jgi:hypothetical protein